MLFRYFSVLAAVLVASGCQPKTDATASTEAAMEVVSGHTGGEISRFDPIVVVFEKTFGSEEPAPETAGLLTFEPALKGLSLWKSATTLEFRPEEPLKAGSEYRATLDLSRLDPTLGKVWFTFAARTQAYSVTLEGPSAGDSPKRQILEGTVETADVADAADFADVLKATHANSKLSVTWNHEDAGTEHRFRITGIRRAEETTDLVLVFDGKPLGVERGETQRVSIPGLNTFAVLSVKAMENKGKYLEVRFSDPLRRKQKLDGLITVQGRSDIQLRTRRNAVRIYSNQTWNAEETVVVHAGIKNKAGYKIKERKEFTVHFEVLKPGIAFAGDGVVLPSGETQVPIKVANLHSVVIEAMVIPDGNLPQFFQVNGYREGSQLERVGKIVWRKVVHLRNDRSVSNRWRRYGLDLGPLVDAHATGMFRLKVSFRPQDATFSCPGGRPEDQHMPEIAAGSQTAETSFWDSAQENWGGESYYSAWENRENPCHAGYYRDFGSHKNYVEKNILLADIGVMAKLGRDRSLLVVATDLKTADPIADAQVTVTDFQHQELARGLTDQEGMARYQLSHDPFLVKVVSGARRSFIRLDKGQSLALGHFDVSGIEVKEGLQGFFYGERGVWRPGDTIHLSFMLVDESGRLPGNHPVDFTLVNPRGQVVKRDTIRNGVNGLYVWPAATDPDAPTGTYLAKATIGGAVFTKSLPVETVVPNRLKIEMDFGTEQITGKTFEASLSAAWLHGAPAPGLRYDLAVALAPRTTTFSKFAEYVFDDPSRAFKLSMQDLDTGHLDDESTAVVSTQLPAVEQASGMMSASFRTRVYEPNDAHSVDRHVIPLSPYERYVGIRTPKGDQARGMLLTDTEHPVDIAVVDARGESVRGGEISLALYKIKWRWWWEKGAESLPDYAASRSFRPVAKGKVKLKNGRARWTFQVKHPDWGRYLLLATDKVGGHRTGKIVYIDWPGWAGRAQKDQPGGASVLQVASDKAEYAVGDEIAVTVPTPHQGRVLITLENGTKVIDAKWVEADGESVQTQFRAGEEMAPAVYVNATLLQPYRHGDNDLPLRMYGIRPLKIVHPKSKLEPSIEMPKVMEPDGRAVVQVREANGRPMTYSLALVDEGLLGLTRFSTPDPWNHFYRRHALGVRSWDFFDDVFGAYGGKLERMLAIGGGDANQTGAKDRANRFPPMVHFSGPHILEGGATERHTIKLPQYVGSVRAMVVARDGRAFGQAERNAFVRKPVMVLATLPRVLGPGESVGLPVSVFALEDNVTSVRVRVETEGPVKLEGAEQKTVKFAQPGDKVVTFRLKVADRTGVARVRVFAKGGKASAQQTFELDVRRPTLRRTRVAAKALQGGATWSHVVEPMGSDSTAVLELSSVPPINLEARLQSLLQYPHGCAEQTTSTAFPQLYLSEILDLNGDETAYIKNHVQGAIEKLVGFQQSSGGFAYWHGQGTDDWITSYIGHFLVEAQSAGYPLPSAVLSQWKKYQRRVSGTWSGERDIRPQAYRLYALALAGSPELGAMNRLEQTSGLDTLSRSYLAGAYALAGQPEVARRVLGTKLRVADYVELSDTFGSTPRDEGVLLSTLVALEDWTRAAAVAERVSKWLSGESFLSTHATATALVGMAHYMSQAELTETVQATAQWNGNSVGLAGTRRLVRHELDLVGKNNLELKNDGAGILYARVVRSGIPKPGAEKRLSSGLDLSVWYKTPTGNALDVSGLDQGTDFVAHVTVTNSGKRGAYQELALSHVVPSGWEIDNNRLQPGVGGPSALYEYQDVRDDRVYTYFDLKQGASKTFKVRLHAAYRGRFYLPVIAVEAMYDATIVAQEPGSWIEVVRPGFSG